MRRGFGFSLCAIATAAGAKRYVPQRLKTPKARPPEVEKILRVVPVDHVQAVLQHDAREIFKACGYDHSVEKYAEFAVPETAQQQDYKNTAIAVDRNPGAVFGAAVHEDVVADQVEAALPDPAGDGEEKENVDEFEQRVAADLVRSGFSRSGTDLVQVRFHGNFSSDKKKPSRPRRPRRFTRPL